MSPGITELLRVKDGFFLSPNNTPRIRTVIEGGFQDSWHRHHVDAEEFELPHDITGVSIAMYGLDYFARAIPEGALEPTGIRSDAQSRRELRYDFLGRIQRPCTLVTEDGRVFTDTELIHSLSLDNRERLPRFLEALLGQHRSFDEAYAAIKNGKREV